MENDSVVTLAKELVKVTTAKYWDITINLLLLTVGARNAYFNDYDNSFSNLSIQSMPTAYRNAFLKLCGYMEFLIQPLYDPITKTTRFKIINPRKMPRILTTNDRQTGKQLGFPCSSKAMDMTTKGTITAMFMIRTEHGQLNVTSFGCFQSEQKKLLRWFHSMQDALQMLYWMKLFKKFEPVLLVQTMKQEGEEYKIIQAKEYTMNMSA